MRVLLGAASAGFGPVAKLTAISRMLSGHHRTAVGTAVAADFLRRNLDAYDEFVDTTDPAALGKQLAATDCVVAVMDADLVFAALAAGRPVVFFDSLLAFWRLPSGPEAIAERCARVRRDGFATIGDHLGDLSPHERKYAAHLLADASAAQTFPGVRERAAELRRLGAAHVHLTGSIVDEAGLAAAGTGGDGPDLLMSLGGFKNFYLDYDRNNAYLKLFARWIPALLRDWPRFARISVCSGAYGDGRGHSIVHEGRRADFECLHQREFLRAVASSHHYMLTPGLTAIHEAVRQDRFPMGLPEQHFGHIANLAGLDHTRFGRSAARFGDLIDGFEVPAHDLRGTTAIVTQVGRVVEDDAAFDRFRRGMNERFESFVALTPGERAAGVAELRVLFDGPPVAEVLDEMMAAVAPARSTP